LFSFQNIENTDFKVIYSSTYDIYEKYFLNSSLHLHSQNELRTNTEQRTHNIPHRMIKTESFEKQNILEKSKNENNF
jgi:hypothetical protein